ncbi:MAG TPA: sugar-transfer associated ATP-grasp domain-containing protein [Steroidobacteraceae bacterium]|nr:sugar-transfer associated ATP-grasp domain-containing protein [Steroidobacteraceae bacterium]
MSNRYQRFLKAEVWPYFRCRNRKPLRQQWREARALWAAYHCVPYHYFKHRLYERGARADFLGYVPPLLVQRFQEDFNPPTHLHMVIDKLETNRILGKLGVPCIETLFSIDADGVVRGGDGASLDAVAAASALNRIDGMVFIKPVDWGVGEGAHRLRASAIDAGYLAKLRKVVIQPVLRNHPAIDAINAGALNTVRIDSLVEDGRCTLTAAYLKLARGTMQIDNWSKGSIAVGIDMATGALNETGLTHADFGRTIYAAHPDSGVRFGSVTLPAWRELLEVAERAALGLQPHRSLGHDIAITADGPVFVEANETAGFFTLQEACGPMAATRLGQRALEHWLQRRGITPGAH